MLSVSSKNYVPKGFFSGRVNEQLLKQPLPNEM